jgi:type I restriction enzyme S subunit
MTSSITFGEVAELRSEKVDPKLAADSFYVGLEHIEQQTLSINGHGFGSDVDSQKQKFYMGDILFGKLRPYFRKVVIAPFDGICSTDIWVVKPKHNGDRNFLFYWMASEEFIQKSTYASEGGRMPRAKWDWVINFQIPAKSPEEQAAIGITLRALDEKISINRVTAKTLEEIAETIFKSWFVDFEPVKAKMAGEAPLGIDDATASLFPDSFVNSEIGEIPNGWEIQPIGNVLSASGGTTPSTSNPAFWDGEHFWTTPKDLSKQSGLITTGSARSLTDEGLRQISSGLLPLRSVLMSCRAPIGYLSINAVPTAVNQGFITLSKDDLFSPLYVLFWIRANMKEILSRAGGATFAEITRKAFKEIPFVKPPKEILSAFSKIADPILFELESMTLENQQLLELRDSMLPRLLSGDLQIPKEMEAS